MRQTLAKDQDRARARQIEQLNFFIIMIITLLSFSAYLIFCIGILFSSLAFIVEKIFTWKNKQ